MIEILLEKSECEKGIVKALWLFYRYRGVVEAWAGGSSASTATTVI